MDAQLSQNITGKPMVGGGIFTVGDVAHILNLPKKKVTRWISEFWDKKFAHDLKYSFGEKNSKSINFFTLIEFYVFYQLREQKVGVVAIQKAHDEISAILRTPYPFAHAGIKYEQTSKKVWYEILDNLLVKADGKRQISIRELIEPFLNKVEFNTDKIAERFFPLENSRNIVIDPKRQYGQPIIAGTSIKAETIYSMHIGGEEDENICSLFNLSMDKVKDAIDFYSKVAA